MYGSSELAYLVYRRGTKEAELIAENIYRLWRGQTPSFKIQTQDLLLAFFRLDDRTILQWYRHHLCCLPKELHLLLVALDKGHGQAD